MELLDYNLPSSIIISNTHKKNHKLWYLNFQLMNRRIVKNNNYIIHDINLDIINATANFKPPSVSLILSDPALLGTDIMLYEIYEINNWTLLHEVCMPRNEFREEIDYIIPINIIKYLINKGADLFIEAEIIMTYVSKRKYKPIDLIINLTNDNKLKDIINYIKNVMKFKQIFPLFKLIDSIDIIKMIYKYL